MRGLAVDGEKIARADLETRPDDGVGIPFESSVVEHARAIYTRRVHRYDEETERARAGVLAYATRAPADGSRPARRPASQRRARRALAGQTITEDGLGGEAALQLFADVLAPACISVDHPRFLSFIPARAHRGRRCCSTSSCGASSIYGGSWLEGAGAVYAENQALRWLADLAGLPAGAGGVFVQGGTQRQPLGARRRRATPPAAAAIADHPARWGRRDGEAHSSIKHAAAVMDVDVVGVATDDEGRHARRRACARRSTPRGDDGVFAVVATARHDQLRHRRRPRRDRRRLRRARAVAARRRRLRRRRAVRAERRATASAASSAATRSSSTRTSGCSRRSTAARSSTATRSWPARRTPRRPATSTCSRAARSGTRPTTPST